ncbi:MAG: methionyl-tRNA formyltransferase [Clostridia bacterium]|nr:methionyl-tRNA formyltransferase [Deltaproteobacteria bacterium]
MTRLRVIFMGTPDFAVPTLEALIAEPQFDVVCVVTQPDRGVGRGQQIAHSPVKQAALAHGIPIFQPTKMKVPETRESLASYTPDVAVVAAYGRILPPSILEIPRYGCINLHASLLPRHRGAAPIAYAIWKGDKETGVGIMRMEEGLDTGPVYAEARLPIEDFDTTGTLTVKLAQSGAKALVTALPRICRGELAARPQAREGVTHSPPLAKAEGQLDVTKTAAELERQVRAMQPWPVASLTLGANKVLVGKAHVVAMSGPPGEVLHADKHGVVVACGEGALALDEVQLPGKKMIPAAAWVNGRGVAVGAKFA